VIRNARRAARDDAVIAYIGEFNSSASAISIPILNHLNLPQISPSNAYNRLTTDEAGATRGEPDKYYPTGRRTFVRIPPRDTIQSAALLTQAKTDGCRRLLLADDGDTYGFSIAEGIRRQASRLGVPIVGYLKNADRHPKVVAATAGRTRADCFLYGGITHNHAVAIYNAVANTRAHARLYGGDGVCESAFLRPTRALRARFACTIAPLALPSYPGGMTFLTSYEQEFSAPSPDPYSMFGYEAMKLTLDTIAALGPTGNQREAVRHALFATRNRQSVLGTYSITPNGDTTLRDYGIYRADARGHIRFHHAVVAG